MKKRMIELFKVVKMLTTILFFVSFLSYIAFCMISVQAITDPKLENATCWLIVCCVGSFFYEKYYIIAFVIYKIYKWFRPLSKI